MIGKTLSHYEVLEQLGAGGMGEVYKARDTKLGREVALKILPDEFARDAERIARFQREAQLLASLNHPNIASIHGLEQSDGTRFLAMELALGSDLTERITQGPVPVDDALEIARQVADALEEAHDRGIIHRDLKPANINVTADGRVKVLDFGLAKAFEDHLAQLPGDLSQSPTITGMTAAHVILGTAAYMSPEQAKGKTVDRRADIWSFGVVLFEMLTGERLFSGETISETLASVMKDTVPWNRLPKETPYTIERLLRRCLERDPKRRLQAIGEARIAIDAVKSGEADAAPKKDTASTPRRGASAIIPWAVAGIAAIVAVISFGLSQRNPAVDQPLRKYWLDIQVSDSERRPFKVSPDGRRIAYDLDGALWVRDLGALESRLLARPAVASPNEGARTPFWSPDSRWVGYVAQGRLWKIPAEGGSATTVCNAPEGFVGGAWLANDRIVFSTPRGPMYSVSSRGGDPSVLIPREADQDVDFHDPSALPGGAGIIYSLHRNEGVDTIELFANGERKMLLRLERELTRSPQVVNYPVYSATGHIVYRRDQGNIGIWAVPFSLSSLEITGEPFLIAPRGGTPSVSDDGSLLYSPSGEDAPTQLVWVNLDGEIEGVLGKPGRYVRNPAISPDGKQVAYVADENGAGEVWVYDIARDSRTRLTFTPEDEDWPRWIPGSNMVGFMRDMDVGTVVCAKSADGTGDTRILAEKASYPDFSPDGKYLIYQERGETIGDLMKVPLDGNGEPETIVTGGSNLYRPRFSPEGRFITYVSWEGGTATSYVRPFPAGQGKWELPGSWESMVCWNPVGKEILYSTARPVESILAIPVNTEPTLSLGTQRKLFDLEPLAINMFDNFDLSSDGKRFVMVRQLAPEQSRGGIVVVENWLSEFAEEER